MLLMKHLIHRDQIHRDVYFDPMSIALINTPEMQRLGRIYQLGFAHLVFRGGTHTRLSHVMGVAHVAGSLVGSLRSNYEIAQKELTLPNGAIDTTEFLPKSKNHKVDDDSESSINNRWDVLTHLVRWGGLLHDLGHIPLGHTLEDEFSGIYVKHDSFYSPRISYLWNEVTPGRNSSVKSILLDSSLYPASFKELGISTEDVWRTVMLICLFKSSEEKENKNNSGNKSFLPIYEKAIKDLNGNWFHQYMADIVADTICADYIDYLQRDTTNVGLDTFKDMRIVQSYYIGADSETGRLRMSLSLKDKGGKQRLSVCTAAKNMVRHRFDLAEIIYYHKTKVSASAMLAKVFSLIDQPIEHSTPKKTITIDKIDENVSKIISDKNEFEKLRQKNIPDSLFRTLP